MPEKALQVTETAMDIVAMPQLSPQEQIDKASEMAKVLQSVVDQANLARSFGGKKKHLEYEAWQTIAQFFNCTPQTEWTKPILDKDTIVGYEARVNVVNAEGRVIASAESMCMRDEPNWKTKPLYALRSMAQTRTAGKALRSIFAWVAVLAGYSATPADEMSQDFNEEKKASNPASPQENGNPKVAEAGHLQSMWAHIDSKGWTKEEAKAWIYKEFDVSTCTTLTTTEINRAMKYFNDNPKTVERPIEKEPEIREEAWVPNDELQAIFKKIDVSLKVGGDKIRQYMATQGRTGDEVEAQLERLGIYTSPEAWKVFSEKALF